MPAATAESTSQVNHRYYHQVADVLTDLQRLTLTRLLSREEREATSAWQRLKQEPQQPTPKRIRAHLAHVQWLHSLTTAPQALDGVPETMLQQFAEEARALNVARMNALPVPKCYMETVQMLVTPGEHDPQKRMQVREGHLTPDKHPAPDEWTDASEDEAGLVDAERCGRGCHALRVVQRSVALKGSPRYLALSMSTMVAGRYTHFPGGVSEIVASFVRGMYGRLPTVGAARPRAMLRTR